MSELLSFDEWKARGYMINKGSKSVGRSPSGTPLFAREQVSKKPRRFIAEAYDAEVEGYDYEGSREELISEEDFVGMHDD